MFREVSQLFSHNYYQIHVHCISRSEFLSRFMQTLEISGRSDVNAMVLPRLHSCGRWNRRLAGRFPPCAERRKTHLAIFHRRSVFGGRWHDRTAHRCLSQSTIRRRHLCDLGSAFRWEGIVLKFEIS